MSEYCPPEVWLPVFGYEGLYEVSSLGRVRSIDRVVTKGNLARVLMIGRVLIVGLDVAGYPMVGLHRNGHQKNGRVHQLVAAAFLGPRPSGKECCHNNGNRADPRLSNLRYDTKLGNSNDKYRHETMVCGERQHLARLTEGDVIRIRTCGLSVEALAAQYGVAKSTIIRAFNGKTWKHVAQKPGLYLRGKIAA